MGEAKRAGPKRVAELRAIVELEIQRLMTPDSAAERDLLEIIERMTFVEAPRAPVDLMALSGMRRQHCHTNTAACVEADLNGHTQQVSGWWRRGEVFYFHSVVRHDGRLLCVTPQGDPGMLRFAPDEMISWTVHEGLMRAVRGDQFVPFMVRRDPTATIAMCERALLKLQAGVHPLEIRLRS